MVGPMELQRLISGRNVVERARALAGRHRAILVEVLGAADADRMVRCLTAALEGYEEAVQNATLEVEPPPAEVTR